MGPCRRSRKFLPQGRSHVACAAGHEDRGHRAFYGPCREFVQVFGGESQIFKEHVDPGDAGSRNDPGTPPARACVAQSKGLESGFLTTTTSLRA